MANDIVSVDPKMLELLRALQEGKNVLKPYGTEIFILKTYIAGIQYYSAKKNIDDIKEGNFLTFRREPENAYDNKAIIILDLNNNKLGYVPRDDNEVISNLMDGGKNIYAAISKKKSSGDYLNLEIRVYLRDY